MISYEDFNLRIRVDGNRFEVSAQRGLQSVREPFELDLSRSWDLGQLEERGPGEIKDLGSALFDALIRGRVRDLYQQGCGGAGGDAAKGLRIRILLDSRDERLRPLLRLPWEILFDRSADACNLPALDPRRPIVRTIDSIEQTLPSPPGPLRSVLLALSDPYNSVRNPRNPVCLDLDRECAGVEEALGRIPIRPKILRSTTRSSLLESISDGENQIVHFMGHGVFRPAIGEGELLLENERSGRDFLPASTFASFFAGKPMPRLVVLASCHSAEPGRDPAFGPFASVAASLVASGLPAVIAMQTAVRDRSAIRFTQRLYRRLAKGDPVEAAVAEARIALCSEKPETFDWAVPVLFVRGQIGEIAELTNPELPEPGQRPVAKSPEESPLPARSTTIYQRDVGVQVIGDVGQISWKEKGGKKR
jgi:hypothetical protein